MRVETSVSGSATPACMWMSSGTANAIITGNGVLSASWLTAVIEALLTIVGSIFATLGVRCPRNPRKPSRPRQPRASRWRYRFPPARKCFVTSPKWPSPYDPAATAGSQAGASESLRRYCRIALRTTCDIDRSSSRARSFSLACISAGSRTTRGCTSSWGVVGTMESDSRRNPGSWWMRDITNTYLVKWGPPRGMEWCRTLMRAGVVQGKEHRSATPVIRVGVPAPALFAKGKGAPRGPFLDLATNLGQPGDSPPSKAQSTGPLRHPVSAGTGQRSSHVASAALSRSVRNIARRSSRWLYRQTYSFKYPCSHLGETA